MSAFGQAFERLVAAFKRHEDVDRDPENFPEIGHARAELEDARIEVRATRPAAVEHRRVVAGMKADVSETDLGRTRAQQFPQN